MNDDNNSNYWIKGCLAILFVILVYAAIIFAPAIVLHSVLTSLNFIIDFWTSFGIVLLIFMMAGLLRWITKL